MISIRKLAIFVLALFMPLIAMAQNTSQSDYVDWVTSQNANGGVTMPYQEWKAKMEGKTPITEPREECFNALEKNPELQILKSKVALGSLKGQTLEMLANDKKPTPAEKVALARWDALRQPCIVLNQEWASKHQAPNIAILGDKVASEFKVSLADLYAGKITFGQFVKIRQINLDKAKAEAITANQQNQITNTQQQQKQQELNQQAQQAQAQDQAQRRALATQIIMNNKPYQVPMPQAVTPYQMPPFQTPQLQAPVIQSPTNTNCRMIGNTMNCTSY